MPDNRETINRSAADGSAETRRRYSKPEITSRESVELMAAVCQSDNTSLPPVIAKESAPSCNNLFS